jgi:hypothetical protein
LRQSLLRGLNICAQRTTRLTLCGTRYRRTFTRPYLTPLDASEDVCRTLCAFLSGSLGERLEEVDDAPEDVLRATSELVTTRCIVAEHFRNGFLLLNLNGLVAVHALRALQVCIAALGGLAIDHGNILALTRCFDQGCSLRICEETHLPQSMDQLMVHNFRQSGLKLCVRQVAVVECRSQTDNAVLGRYTPSMLPCLSRRPSSFTPTSVRPSLSKRPRRLFAMRWKRGVYRRVGGGVGVWPRSTALRASSR